MEVSEHGQQQRGGAGAGTPPPPPPASSSSSSRPGSGEDLSHAGLQQELMDAGVQGGSSVLIRVHVPELNINKCLQFSKDELVWDVKQQCLAALPKELRESFNYGLFTPPSNGKAGKFLDEERRLTDYPFSGPVGYLELKYKRRVYKMLHLDEKQLKALHTRANLRRLLDYVANRQVEKVAKMCSKGLDPNFHCAETGETPLTVAAITPRSSRVLLALVNGGALLDYRTRDGTTAVHRAVERNNFEAVKTLLDLGASPNYKDSRGLTPLYLAMTPNTDPMLCEALLHDHAVIGAQDTQGWQEVHQACRHGLVQHLEHLLFYGADMNARNASGNTPLHVCAVNGQESCLRLMLFRGADREALNFANQTAYQVAVIAGNLDLAETIQKHRPEEVVPFREPPRFNPKRRPSSNFLVRCGSDPRLDQSASCVAPCLPPCSASSHALLSSLASSSSPPAPAISLVAPKAPPSPSPSDHSLPPFSSACSSLSEASSSSGAQRSEGGDSSEDAASTSIVTDKSMLDTCDIISDSSGVGTSNSGGSAGSGGYDTGGGLLLAGVTAVCVENYNSTSTGHLCLSQGDIVEVTGATDCGLLEGSARGRSGLFPAHCVQEVRLRQAPNLRVQGRRETNLKHFATAPRLKKPLTAEPRTVVLHRSRKGFGFVLRGAKATSPLMELTPSERCPALQYLDDVDTGGVADVAGLRKGDYLLEINGEDVSQSSHEHVVELIKRSGDLVAMRVVSLGEGGSAAAKAGASATLPSRQCATLPRKIPTHSRNPAPLPPRRDPKTTLSVGRARARSLVAELDGGSHQQRSGGDLDEADSEELMSARSGSSESVQLRNGQQQATPPPRTASIRARPTSSRITALELEELFARQGPAPPASPSGSSTPRTPKVYASVAEMKRSRGRHGRLSRGVDASTLHKAFLSTPDLAHLSPSHAGARTWSARGARSQEDLWWTSPAKPGRANGVSLAGREYGHAWRSMERLHSDHAEPVARSLSTRTRSLPRHRSSAVGPPPPPTHPPPPPPVGQVVRMELSRGAKGDYANVRDLPPGQSQTLDHRAGRRTPTSPEPVMSSFRPGPAKLYACPEDVKPVAYRGSGTMPRSRGEGKGRSHSLPPHGPRPQVRKVAKSEGRESPAPSTPAYSSFKPPEAPSSASPAVQEGASTPHSNPYAQPFQHGTPAPPIPEPDYSMSEDESEEGEEIAKVQRRARKSSCDSPSTGATPEQTTASPTGPLSPSAVRESAMSPVFKDLLAQKVAERNVRLSSAGTPAEEMPPSPVLSSPPPPPAPEPQRPPSESSGSETGNGSNGGSANGSNGNNGNGNSNSNGNSNGNGHIPHSFSVEEIQKVKTQLKSSKSYPNDFSQEDGDNSSSGVSSDQDTQPEPAPAVIAPTAAEAPPSSQSPPRQRVPSSPTPTLPKPPPSQAQAQTQAPAQIPKSMAHKLPHSHKLPSSSQNSKPKLSAQAQLGVTRPPPMSPMQAGPTFQTSSMMSKSLERDWQPDGSESSPSEQPELKSGWKKKPEEVSRRSGVLTRNAVSLVQLPPPMETEGEAEPQQTEAATVTPTTAAPPPQKKSVSFMTQERQDRPHHHNTLPSTRMAIQNCRPPAPSAHLRQSVPTQRSRSTDVDTGRPVEVERSIEESLQLIQRHVEQLNMVVPPPPEFDGAGMRINPHSQHHHHHHHHTMHHPGGHHSQTHHLQAHPQGHPQGHPSHGHPRGPPPPYHPGHLSVGTQSLGHHLQGHPVAIGGPTHSSGHHPGYPAQGYHPSHPGQPLAHHPGGHPAQGRPSHHSHLYHLQPPPEEPLLVAPPPEFSDTGEPHKMTIRVGGGSPSPGMQQQRLTPQQHAELLRQRQLEELNRQRVEAVRQKTVRIVGSVPKKAPSK